MDAARVHVESVLRSPSPQQIDGLAFAADTQSEGRGRGRERRWSDEPSKSLLVTIAFDPSRASLPGFPLRVGLGTAKAITRRLGHRGSDVTLKWPNDILVGGKKVAGILCVSSEKAAYAGIGVNILQASFEGEYRTRPTSLAIEGAENTDRFSLLEDILKAVHDAFLDDSWQSSVTKILFKRGTHVRFLEGSADSGTQIEGIIDGIGSEGELVLVLEDGIRNSFASGEILTR